MRTADTFDVVAMLTMFGENGGRSRSHGLRPEVIAAQAVRLSLESLSARCNWKTYTAQYVAMLEQLKARAIGEFGEFHTVVTQCPLFSTPLQLLAGERVMRGGCWAIDFTPTSHPTFSSSSLREGPSVDTKDSQTG